VLWSTRVRETNCAPQNTKSIRVGGGVEVGVKVVVVVVAVAVVVVPLLVVKGTQICILPFSHMIQMTPLQKDPKQLGTIK
jgi:hypothetical protein